MSALIPRKAAQRNKLRDRRQWDLRPGPRGPTGGTARGLPPPCLICICKAAGRGAAPTAGRGQAGGTGAATGPWERRETGPLWGLTRVGSGGGSWGGFSCCYLRGAGVGGKLTIISDGFSSGALPLARRSVRLVRPRCRGCSLTAALCHSRTHPTRGKGRPRSPLRCPLWGWGWHTWLCPCLTRGTPVPSEAGPDPLVRFARRTFAEKS